jgi:flagellar motor switch protein FliG
MSGPGTALAVIDEPGTMSGSRKVAVLLMSIGTDRAAAILRQLAPEEMAEVLREITTLEDVDSDVVNEVIGDFAVSASTRRDAIPGGSSFARDLLTRSVGEHEAAAMLDELGLAPVSDRFSGLSGLSLDELAELVGAEHPQTIAVVLSHLQPERAAGALARLDPVIQTSVAIRIATMEHTPAAAIDAIERSLEARVAEKSTDTEGQGPPVDGVQRLIDVLVRSNKEIEKLVVEGLALHDEALAEEVRAKLFVFEDIVTLDDRAVQQILRQVDSRELAVAMKGVDATVAGKVTSNMSSRAAENLRDEIEVLPTLKKAQITEARTGIVRIIRNLEESGDIVINRMSDDLDD